MERCTGQQNPPVEGPVRTATDPGPLCQGAAGGLRGRGLTQRVNLDPDVLSTKITGERIAI